MIWQILSKTWGADPIKTWGADYAQHITVCLSRIQKAIYTSVFIPDH